MTFTSAPRWAYCNGASALVWPAGAPSRWTIRPGGSLLVGYPPGGATDILARLIGEKAVERWPAVVIENKARRRQQTSHRSGGPMLHRTANTVLLVKSAILHQRLTLHQPEIRFHSRYRTRSRRSIAWPNVIRCPDVPA